MPAVAAAPMGPVALLLPVTRGPLNDLHEHSRNDLQLHLWGQTLKQLQRTVQHLTHPIQLLGCQELVHSRARRLELREALQTQTCHPQHFPHALRVLDGQRFHLLDVPGKLLHQHGDKVGEQWLQASSGREELAHDALHAPGIRAPRQAGPGVVGCSGLASRRRLACCGLACWRRACCALAAATCLCCCCWPRLLHCELELQSGRFFVKEGKVWERGLVEAAQVPLVVAVVEVNSASGKLGEDLQHGRLQLLQAQGRNPSAADITVASDLHGN
mmetsp:Transcript_39449/g.91517  ORF Transcript_39449/g.91517 Transcript_39449/m.91517 type:complete len:273 (-) Transcript_39449:50-868(-)